MAKATTLANVNVQAQMDAMVALLSNGFLDIYSGAQPATADTAITSQVLLASLRLGTPAAGSTPTTGIITFNAITAANAGNTGTAAWFRLYKSDHTTPVMDGSVDVAGNSPNLALSTTAIVSGANVSVTSFSHTCNKVTSGL